MAKRTLPLFVVALVTRVAFAFNGHSVTEGPLRLEIGPVGEVTEYDAPARKAPVESTTCRH